MLARSPKRSGPSCDVIVEEAADAVEMILTDGVDAAMARFNATLT